MPWLVVDSGYGAVDYMLRVRLKRDSAALEIDGHSPDPKHPLRQNNRKADPVSNVYRTNEFLPAEPVDLSANEWHTVKLRFKGDTVDMSVDALWTRQIKRSNFDTTKRKLLWMQNGGTQGIEIDDVSVLPTP